MHFTRLLRAAMGGRFRLLVVLLVLAAWMRGPSGRLGAQEAGSPGFESYTLRHVRATEIAPQLRNLLSESAGPGIEILVDRQGNRILVRGPGPVQRLAAGLIDTLDRSRPAAKASGPESVPVLQGYRVSPEELERRVDELRAAYPPDTGVRIAPDARTEQLLVVAPAEVHEQIAARMGAGRGATGGRPPDGPALEPQPQRAEGAHVRMHALQHISGRELEEQFQQFWGQSLPITLQRNGEQATLRLPSGPEDETVVHIDRRQDRVRISGPEPLVTGWERVIRRLDRPSGDNDGAQLVSVRQAEPARIRQAISLVRTAVRQAPAVAADGPRPAASRSPRGPGGPRDGRDLVARMLQQDLNQGQPVPPAGQPEAAPQDPEELPPEELPPDEVPEDAALIGPVQIEFVEELGVFIVRGHRRDVERVMQIIEEIERQAELTQPEVEIYHLEHTDSQAMAALASQAYDAVFAPRQGPVSVMPLVRPNALLLLGRIENLATVVDLIERLDQPHSPATQLKVFQLQHMSAVDAEQTIRNFLVERPGPPAADEELRAGLGTRVRIIAEYRSNALIVQASPRDLREVTLLIRRIDVPTTKTRNELRVFRLRNTLAEELAPVLQEAIRVEAMEPDPRITPRSAILQFLQIDAEGNKILESGILSDVQVSADVNSNALLVRGPPESMTLIAAVIEQLDRLPDAVAQIKVFTLQNADATNLTLTLQQLFGSPDAAAALAASPEGALVPLRFSVDVRTNSIIVTGAATDLTVVETLLVRLDEETPELRKTTVYRLHNAPATFVAAALIQMLQQERFVMQFALAQVLSPLEQVEREVIVVPEEVTNSLVISATPRFREQIMQVIEELDRRPPMVMIQVLIAEVLLEDIFEFGVELGLQDSLLFDRSLGITSDAPMSPGFGFLNQALGNSGSARSVATRNQIGTQGLSSFNLGRSSAATGYGGFVFSAASDAVNILVRAMQDQGRAQVLSNPKVMTLDNTDAFVQVGARVPRIIGATIPAFGGLQTATTDVDVGVLLRVRPRISPDGLVIMQIDAEKSEVNLAQGIPVAVGIDGTVIESPQIDTTTAQTTISARSGQTVVFAGLITKDRAVISRRVPWVSDIPVVGRLFRFDRETERRTELLIVMTPQIIYGEEDQERLNMVETDRMSWCLADVLEIHGQAHLGGDHGLWGPERAPLIFPDLDPSGVETIPTPANEPTPALQPARSSRREPSVTVPTRTSSTARPTALRKAEAGPIIAPAQYEQPETGPSRGGLSRLPPDNP